MSTENVTSQDLQSGLSPDQILYAEYLAGGRVDSNGAKIEKQEMAKKLGVDPSTLWRWQQLPEFKQVVFDRSMSNLVEYIPTLNQSMMNQAVKKGSVPAYTALMRQFELLKADKQEVTHTGTVEFANIVPRAKD